MKEIKLIRDKSLKEKAAHLIPEEYVTYASSVSEDDDYLIVVSNSYCRTDTGFRILIIEKATQHYLTLTESRRVSKSTPLEFLQHCYGLYDGNTYNCKQTYNSNLKELNRATYVYSHIPETRFVTNLCDSHKIYDYIYTDLVHRVKDNKVLQHPIKIRDRRILRLSAGKVIQYLNTPELRQLSFEELDVFFNIYYFYYDTKDKIKAARHIYSKYKDCLTIYLDYYRIRCNYLRPADYPKYPKVEDVQRYHDEAMREYNRKFCRENLDELNEDYKPVYDVHKYLEYQNDKYHIILPKDLLELDLEGRTLHHCVGSYKESVAKNLDIILFLRKNILTPWITINLNSELQFRQIHGINNCNLYMFDDYKDIVEFLKEWIKEKNLDLESFSKINKVCCHL